MHRRDFPVTLPALIVRCGGAAGASPNSVSTQAIRYPLGMQLFTLIGRDRPMTWESYSAAIETAASMGYELIELAGLWGFNPETIRKRAEQNGLR